jgi:hypothetical protein
VKNNRQALPVLEESLDNRFESGEQLLFTVFNFREKIFA